MPGVAPANIASTQLFPETSAVPGVTLYGVKVLDCKGSGRTSAVIKGIDWVTANAARP